MATLTIRNLDDEAKERIRLRGALNGRSMEAEARIILERAITLPLPPQKGLGTWLHEQFAEAGLTGLDLELPERNEMPRIIEFEE
jgi:plasmid stability protein